MDRRLSRRSLLGAAALATTASALPGAGLTGCASSPAPALPADQVVLTVHPWPGMWGALAHALASPSIHVRGDGRILQSESPVTTTPARHLERWAEPHRLSELIADIADAFDDHDFGDPQITDLGSSSYRWHGAGEPREVSLYADGERFEQHLAGRQRRHRRRLRQAISRIVALAADQPGVAFVPESVAVFEQRPDADTTAETVWPGPPPDDFLRRSNERGRMAVASGTLTGAVATRVLAAARANPGQLWRVEGRARVLAVNPLP